MDYHAKTIILHIDPATPEPDRIAQAAEVLRAGGLVAFPTETVYGLGADALNATALDRIYLAKRRPASDPLIAHIADATQLALLAADVPYAAQRLAAAFWPGPLTMVLRRAERVPANIAAGMDTVAVRMPIHPIARALIAAAGTPIAAPSANTFTRPSATTAAHVLEDLYGRVDVVIDGGATPLGVESTVIDLTGAHPVVLRPGGLILSDLQRILPDITSEQRFLAEGEAATSPGQLTKHYAPRARVMLYDGAPQAVREAIADTAQRYLANGRRVGARIIALGARADKAAIARVLFGAMRALDGQGVDVILVPLLDGDGLGEAIRDRLLRAAEGRVYRVGGSEA
ncbi:MAG: L-threonylcarbamoyladenylate synthase [Anaerolineae bacterium]|nr:L-threonylcarbamoyladenylate synthase [Anaerolineae bacterium]